MLKKLCVAAISAIMLITASVPVFAEGVGLKVDAKSAVIMELSTGRTIFEQAANEKLSPASVTKIMTILLIYEAIEQGRIKWDDVVTVSTHASQMGGSQVYLAENEKQTVKELTKSVVIASANDAAVAMAEFIGGTEENFVAGMNKKAQELGMINTNFMNACGLDETNHYTSAYDIALMSRELMTKYPDVKVFTTTWMDSITHKTSKGESVFGLTNTNKLVRWYEGATGLKTGSTEGALYCLSGTAEKNGMALVAVVMAAPTADLRFAETTRMLDYGFANYAVIKGGPAGTDMGQIPIYKGTKENAPVVVKTEVTAVIEKGEAKELVPEVKMLDALQAPVTVGTKAGEIVYSFNGKEVGRSDLIVNEDIERASLGTTLGKVLAEWFE